MDAEADFDAREVDEREGCDVRVSDAVDVVTAVVADVATLEFGEPIVLVIIAVSDGG